MAYVPQADEVDWNFPVSVFDVVMMGRYGYMNIFRIPSRKDRRIVMRKLGAGGHERVSDSSNWGAVGRSEKAGFFSAGTGSRGQGDSC